MDNATRPTPPNKSEGCYNCGAGLDETFNGVPLTFDGVLLCLPCLRLIVKEWAIRHEDFAESQ